MLTISKIRDFSFATKTFLLLTIFLFSIFAFNYHINEASADVLYCPKANGNGVYGCGQSGECATDVNSPSSCPGEWVNCYNFTEAGKVYMRCTCSVDCSVVGRTITGAACIAGDQCSYSYGGSCNGSGFPCSRTVSYGGGGGGGGGEPPPPVICPIGNVSISPMGGSNLTVYQGESASLPFYISTTQSYTEVANEISNCPSGAICGAKQTRMMGLSDGSLPGSMTLGTGAMSPGVYSVSISAYTTNKPDCTVSATYSVTVKPSRKMVCDGGWYEIPPGSIPYNTVNSGPVVLYNNGASNFEKYFKASFNGRQLTSPSTWGSGNFSLNCRYTSGIGSTCTWDLPDYQMPFDTIRSWPPNSGTMGATASAVDSNTPNNRTVTLRRNGNRFEYSCTNNSPISPVCDNSWRYLPQGGATPAQPVGVFVGASLDSQYRDSVAIGVRGSGGASTGAYVTSCKFNGTNICTWDSSWASLGAVTSYPLNMSLGWSLDLNLKTTWAGGEWVKNINRNSGWSGWANQGADNNISWGQPFRTQDKLGRYWQFRSINGSVAYACGATPVCVTLNYDSAKSSISKTNLASGEAFTVKCDYGVRGIDAAGVTTGGGATCAFSSWDNGNNSRTTANFNCTAGNVGGTFPVSCTNTAGTPSNVCAQSNSLGNITITAPALPTATLTASPSTIPYNTASTLSWNYSNASSCTITPPGSISGYPSGSGSVSTGNLTSSRNYTLNCQNSSGINISASVTVTVQAPVNRYTLNVVRSGQGTVTSNPAGINCGSDCTENYDENTTVVLTAVPATGRIFTGWGGACSGRGSCSVLINGEKTVLANFAVDPNFKEF